MNSTVTDLLGREWAILSLGSIRLDHHDHIAGWGSQPSGELVLGRGGRPELEGASLNDWPIWRVGILLSELICN